MCCNLFGGFQSPPPLLAHFPCLKKSDVKISVMLLCVRDLSLKQMTSFHKIWYEYYIV